MPALASLPALLRRAAPALLVVALVLVCYAPALHGVRLWDDPAHIPRPELQSPDGLRRIWNELGATQQYYPVLFSAFWLEHRLWGDAMLGYHLGNAALHATACCLLAAVLRRLWSMRATHGASEAAAPRGEAAWFHPSWWAALLFAVHPVSVESVAWITEQKNTLSLVLALLASLAFLRFAETRRAATYAGATLLFLAAIGAKTSVVILPPVLLVLLWWRRGSLGWKRDVLPLAPWFAGAIGFGLLTNWFERAIIGADGAEYALTLPQRTLLAGRIVWFFLGKLFWPLDRAFFYHRWDVAAEAGGWWLLLGAAVAVTLGLAWLARRRGRRGPCAAWLVLGGALFPVLGFFNVFSFQFAYVADHYHYVAAAAALGALAAGAVTWLEKKSAALRRGAAGLGALLIAGLAALSFAQSGLYRSNETLFRDNLARVPDSWMARRILAHTIAKDPARSAEAVAEYRRTLEVKPDLPEAHLGLAVELAKTPATRAEAITAYERALALRPHYLEAHHNLAVLLAGEHGREADALAHFTRALELAPDSAPTHFHFGNFLARQPGRMADAAREFAEAARLQPDYAAAHANLGNALAAIPTRRGEALQHFETALRLDPRLAWVHHNVAMLLAGQPGRLGDAEQHLRAALAAEPNYADAHNSLGIVLAQQNRLAEAEQEWRRALECDPRHANAAQNLQRLQQMRGR